MPLVLDYKLQLSYLSDKQCILVDIRTHYDWIWPTQNVVRYNSTDRFKEMCHIVFVLRDCNLRTVNWFKSYTSLFSSVFSACHMTTPWLSQFCQSVRQSVCSPDIRDDHDEAFQDTKHGYFLRTTDWSLTFLVAKIHGYGFKCLPKRGRQNVVPSCRWSRTKTHSLSACYYHVLTVCWPKPEMGVRDDGNDRYKKTQTSR